MTAIIKSTFIIVCIYFFQNCAPSRFIKPLEKKQQAASFSFGGPMIQFAGAPIPIPFTTLAYGYGLTNKVTGFGSLHTTSLLFGNLQSDIGTTLKLFEIENKFGLSASPALQIAYNIRNTTGFRVWPSADVNTYFHIMEKPSYIYAGANSWFEFSKYKAHNEIQQRHVIPNLHLGYMIVKPKWQHQFELSYLGLGIPNKPGVVDYIGISGKGTLGFYYCLIRKF
ncbi:MAG: hypothetical protein H0U95_12865 [Bacteroidetes bacterium]|nr:hypothetical protein [Bacteroidota bacterium]